MRLLVRMKNCFQKSNGHFSITISISTLYASHSNISCCSSLHFSFDRLWRNYPLTLNFSDSIQIGPITPQINCTFIDCTMMISCHEQLIKIYCTINKSAIDKARSNRTITNFLHGRFKNHVFNFHIYASENVNCSSPV